MMIIWGLLVRLLSTGIQGLILKNTVCVLPHHSSTFLLEARDEIDLYSFFRESPKQYPVLIPTLYCQVGAFAYFRMCGLVADCRG